MRAVKAQLLRNNAFGKGFSKRHKFYKTDKKTGQVKCDGPRELYKVLKKQYKRNRMNHL